VSGAPRDLLIVGCGGFGRETAAAVRAINAERPLWRLVGFLDDTPSLWGEDVSGVRVLGPAEYVSDHPDAAVAITTGRPDDYLTRPAIRARLGLAADRLATLIHPRAAVGWGCSVGAGSILLANSTLTADCSIGSLVAVMPGVVVPHDVIVGDHVTLASAAVAGGGCVIADGAYIGSGARIREGVRIGERSLIGMGSVVTRDVPAERLWRGAPARDIGPAPIAARASLAT
jgi:sugar O-acyltransferase (sialic acid O-acetyltransferase NeuD family)